MANELEWIDTVEKRGDARLVGQDVWINQRTGEIIEAQTLTKEVKGDVDVGFEKLWVGHILEAVDEVGNAKMKVLFGSFATRTAEHGQGDFDDIAAKTGSSRSTVARLMASLRKANVVRLSMVAAGCSTQQWCSRGHSRRMNVLIRYQAMEQQELPLEPVVSERRAA